MLEYYGKASKPLTYIKDSNWPRMMGHHKQVYQIIEPAQEGDRISKVYDLYDSPCFLECAGSWCVEQAGEGRYSAK